MNDQDTYIYIYIYTYTVCVVRELHADMLSLKITSLFPCELATPLLPECSNTENKILHDLEHFTHIELFPGMPFQPIFHGCVVTNLAVN